MKAHRRRRYLTIELRIQEAKDCISQEAHLVLAHSSSSTTALAHSHYLRLNTLLLACTKEGDRVKVNPVNALLGDNSQEVLLERPAI